MRAHRIPGLLIGLALVLSSCGVFDPGGRTTSSPAPASPVISQSVAPSASLADLVSTEVLTQRLEELERITLGADGSRGPGTEGYEAAAAYIEGELAATGAYDVVRQPFTIQLPHPGESQLVGSDGRVINQAPLGFSAGTDRDGISGVLVAPDSGTGCLRDDYADITGAIALVDRGGCTFREKMTAAAQAGAVMVIVANDRDGGLYGTVDNSQAGDIPIVGITQSEGRQLASEMAAGEVALQFTFTQRIESVDTFNLIATSKTGDPDNVVLAGAHLDTVLEGPGTNDNGSGSMILLETAVQLAASEPTNQVRFAWWGGEEWGLLGSIHWVNDLVASDPGQLQRLAAYVNVDMVASPNYVIGVYEGDSRPIKAIYTDYFDSIGQPWIDFDMGQSSDHAAFLPSGVPVGGLFTGAGDTKTDEEQELFGGSSGQEHDSNYHQASDTLANLSTEALGITGKASAHVIGVLAGDTSAVNGQGSGNEGTPTAAQGFGYAGTL